ncbi:hypothetical protein BTW08_15935 [Salinicola sp. MH3R3-1]|uniref:hypothetical protein n=1 Tax=Salinicola sp. MH3R3-1 TaxID=1928762 RepID=UPI00094E6A08|nr:hypothetical protein [Salinicola sp. MH3R3-1]OLO06729.1 hypothetical protein BTW08_15935 [Salinicola sp. MH3R3-1]
MALDPDRITLCWPNVIDTATLSGGAWLDSLPLELVQDEILAVRCKSADAAPASTWFDITLDKPRPVQCLALPAHSMSATARYRVRIYGDAAQQFLLWDSAWQTVWPQLFATSELEWEYDNFWFGTISEDDRALYTPLLTVFADDVQLAQSVRVEIDDVGNSEGAVRLGRVFLSDAWQPKFNVSHGVQHGFDSATTFEEAGDRTEYADIKRQRRTASFSLDWLSEEEAYQRIYSLQRVLGTHGELLYAFNLASRPESFARTFLARQQQLDALSQPYANTHTNKVNLLEIL